MLKIQRRDVFNTIQAHLLKQNARSMGEYDSAEFTGEDNPCMYRNEDGLSCAVGCLITDDNYDKTIEGMGMTPSVLTAIESSLDIEVDQPLRTMLTELQHLHDSVDVGLWKNELIDLEDTLTLNGTI